MIHFKQRHKRPEGKRVYLYRAVNKKGLTVDSLLSEKRDEPAVRAYFIKAIGSNGLPEKVTMDKSGANIRRVLTQSIIDGHGCRIKS